MGEDGGKGRRAMQREGGRRIGKGDDGWRRGRLGRKEECSASRTEPDAPIGRDLLLTGSATKDVCYVLHSGTSSPWRTKRWIPY